jgi:hypothetical protein
MSLTKILRNVALGGSLLLSSLGCITNSGNELPGFLGDQGDKSQECIDKNGEPIKPRRKRKFGMDTAVSDMLLTDRIGDKLCGGWEIVRVSGRVGENRFAPDTGRANCNFGGKTRARLYAPIETFIFDGKLEVGVKGHNLEFRSNEDIQTYTATDINLDIGLLRDFDNVFIRGGVRYQGNYYDVGKGESAQMFADHKNDASRMVADYGVFLGIGIDGIDQASLEIGYSNGDIFFNASGPTGREMFANRDSVSVKGKIYSPIGGFDGKQIKFLDSYFLLNFGLNYSVDKYNLFDMVQNNFEFYGRAEMALVFDILKDELPNIIVGFYFDFMHERSKGDRMEFRNTRFGPGIELVWRAEPDNGDGGHDVSVDMVLPFVQYINDDGKHDFVLGIGIAVRPPRKK